jgi:hypothetical protein
LEKYFQGIYLHHSDDIGGGIRIPKGLNVYRELIDAENTTPSGLNVKI